MSGLNLIKNIHLKNIKIIDKFWSKYQELIHTTVLPYQYDVINDNIKDIEPSHAIRNFRIAAGLEKGEFYGFVFQDTDVAKWLETLSYSLINHPDPDLEKLADEVIDIIKIAQQEDGYLNTYFIIKEPDKRWTNLHEAHELYSAGHFIEAAVAYFNATGKRKLLDIICKYADLIDNTFGPDEGKIKGYCGHPEIELALYKLYEVTGNERYLKLCQFFIDERGRKPSFLLDEPTFGELTKAEWCKKWYMLDYHQAHKPVREQEKAEGHAVRAMYLYTAMADIVRETGDTSLHEALKKIWNNVIHSKMYITGGIGSQEFGERFTFDYDLPNNRAFSETCASIGLVFWAHSMLFIDNDSQYSDIIEKVLYNSALSGISLDGKKYYYSNPLEVVPEAVEKRYDLNHIKKERQSWFACACCPLNISRLITSIGQYVYSQFNNNIYVHLYMSNKVSLKINEQDVSLTMNTDYPWKEDVQITVNTGIRTSFSLKLRIPEWCNKYSVKINNKKIKIPVPDKGYLSINRNWSDNDQIILHLEMPVMLIQANPNVRENAGKAAIQRGPIIYCLEEIDNGINLPDIKLHAYSKLKAQFDDDLFGGIVTIKGDAFRSNEKLWNNILYQCVNESKRKVMIKAIPYSMWCNRTPGEMIVWINYIPQLPGK